MATCNVVGARARACDRTSFRRERSDTKRVHGHDVRDEDPAEERDGAWRTRTDGGTPATVEKNRNEGWKTERSLTSNDVVDASQVIQETKLDAKGTLRVAESQQGDRLATCSSDHTIQVRFKPVLAYSI